MGRPFAKRGKGSVTGLCWAGKPPAGAPTVERVDVLAGKVDISALAPEPQTWL
jgi:hypothetical protein